MRSNNANVRLIISRLRNRFVLLNRLVTNSLRTLPSTLLNLNTTTTRTTLRLLDKKERRRSNNDAKVRTTSVNHTVRVSSRGRRLTHIRPLISLFLRNTMMITIRRIILRSLVLVSRLLRLLLNTMMMICPFLLPKTKEANNNEGHFFSLKINLTRDTSRAILSNANNAKGSGRVFFVFRNLATPLLSLFYPQPSQQRN